MIEVPEFLRPLVSLTQPFPEAAVREALVRWEEAGPVLLAGLEEAAAHPETVPGDAMLHLFALYLFAEKRETRSFPPAVRLARYPEVDALLGDTTTSGLPAILAAVSGGDVRPIKELIEDVHADEFARGAGMRALGTMVEARMLNRAELASYLGELLGGRLDAQPGNVWDSTISVCADFGIREHEEAKGDVAASFFVLFGANTFFDSWKL